MSTARPIPEEGALRQRFTALRRRIRLIAGLRGGGWLVGAVFLTTILLGVADYFWRLPALPRAGILVALLSGVAILVHRYLVRPLSARNDDFSLALRVEEQYPTLNDALASTVQFLDQPRGPEGESAPVRREAVRRALNRAAHCDFNKVVDGKGLRWAAGTAAVALAGAITLTILFPAAAKTAVVRLAAPFGKHEWPRDTQLALEIPRTRLGSNQDFVVSGVVTGVIPENATIVIRPEGFNERKEPEIRLKRDGLQARFTKRWKPGELSGTFRVQVYANDAESEEIEIKIIPPPKLVDRDGQPSPQITLDVPRYTDLPTPEVRPGGDGELEIIAGTKVTLKGAADRPLRRAWIEFLPESTGEEKVGQAIPDRVVAELEGDGSRFTVQFTPTVVGQYELHLEDDRDLTSRKQYRLGLYADPAPRVELDRPSAKRDVLSALPSATMVLDIDAHDAPPSLNPRLQVGALRSVKLRYRTGENEPRREVVYYDHSTAPARLLAPLLGASAVAPAAHLRPQRLGIALPLPLAQFKHADGTPLRPGDYLFLRAAADDFDDVTPNKPAGESKHEIKIAIVDYSGLELAHNEQQTTLQNALKDQRDKERTAAQQMRQLENRIKEGAVPDTTELEMLAQMERMQHELTDKFGPEQLRAQTERIQESLRQNGMPNDPRRARMEQVERELKRLAENVLPVAEEQLADARRKAEAAAQAEDRARAATRKAEEEEKEARRLEDEVKKKEAAALKAPDARAKEKLLNEALQDRAKAKEVQAEAARSRQQAETEHRTAQDEFNKSKARDPLTAARKREEEVEKTLNDLLARLEPSSVIAEIKGEARDIRDAQEQLMREAEAIERQTRGKEPMELTLEERERIARAQAEQQSLAERTQRLLDKMRDEAKKREQTEPELVEKMKDALEQAEKDNITGTMREAEKELRANQLNKATQSQRQSSAALESLARKLGRQSEAEQAQLVKKLREAEKELEEIKKKAEELRKKKEALEAQQGGTPEEQEKRKDELKRLQKQEEELRKQTQELAKRLSREGRAERARQALDKAARDPDEMLERLNEAERDLKRAARQEQETLEREQLTRILEVIERLRDRQAALNAEAERIQKEVKDGKAWTRGLKSSMLGLRDGQNGVRDETKDIVGKELANTPVFARILTRSAEAMEQAGTRAEELGKQGDADVAKLPDAELAKQQKEALRRLEAIIDAVKSQLDAPRPQPAKPNNPGGGEEEPESTPPPPQTGLPPLAQLKLLRAMQKDVNRRSDEFKQAHPDLNQLSDVEKTEYNSIGRDQQDVRELLEEMRRRPGEPMDDKPEEKKAPEMKPGEGEKQ